MERRIQNLLQKREFLSCEEKEELCSFLKLHLIHQYYSSLPSKSIIENLKVNQHAQNDIIYEQGDPIHTYHILINGQVLLTHRHREQEDRWLLEGPSLLGECYQMNAERRGKTARVVSTEAAVISIGKQAYHSIMHVQIEQYSFIIDQISQFANISQQSLTKASLSRFLHFTKQKMYEQVILKPNTIYIISKGQCLIVGKNNQFVANKFNCLGVEKYFSPKSEPYTYYSHSPCLLLIGVDYQAINLLPEEFQKQIQFLFHTHQITLEVKQLPRIQRFTEKEAKPSVALHEESKQRRSYKQNKSHSLFGLQEGYISQLTKFRKQFVLGFQLRQIANLCESLEKKGRIIKPKGYFNIEGRRQISEKTIQMGKRRQWGVYLQAKSEQKQRNQKRCRGNVKVDSSKQNKNISPTKKEETFKNIFRRYHNIPSIDPTPNKNSSKLFKITKGKPQFNSNKYHS